MTDRDVQNKRLCISILDPKIEMKGRSGINVDNLIGRDIINKFLRGMKEVLRQNTVKCKTLASWKPHFDVS